MPVVPDPEHLFPESIRFAEPYFASLGKEVRLSAAASKDTWTNLAVKNGPFEKVFAVTLGYAVFGLLVAVYLNLLTVGNARTAGRAVRNVIRQQLLVVKVRFYLIFNTLICPNMVQLPRLPASSSSSLSCSPSDAALFWMCAPFGFSPKPTSTPESPSSLKRPSQPCSITGSPEPYSCIRSPFSFLVAGASCDQVRCGL